MYMDYCSEIVFTTFAKIKQLIFWTTNHLGVYDFFPSSCQKHEFWAEISYYSCKVLGFGCDGLAKELLFNEKNMCVVNGDWNADAFPSGTSTKAIMHYAQAMSENVQKTFQKFDYGFWGNIWRYGSPSVPSWDLKKMNADIVLIGGTNDSLATQRDVSNMESMLDADRTTVYYMNDWNHLSFACPPETTRFHEILDKELM